MLLQEYNDLDYAISELNESGGLKNMKLRGRFQHADVPNGNGRYYPRSVLESCIAKSSSALTERRMLGELDHPDEPKINLEKVSHVVTKLRMENDGQVYGEAEVLPTHSGKILEQLLRSKVKLGISSRGHGSVKKGRDGLLEVQNDYKLVTFDIVSNPSTPDAYPNVVCESQDGDNSIKSNLEDLISDVLDEDTGSAYPHQKFFIVEDNKKNRIYIVEDEFESYGHLKFHASHEYHVLVKNEKFEEKIGLNEENLGLIRSVYGKRTYGLILEKIKNLGFDPETLRSNL